MRVLDIIRKSMLHQNEPWPCRLETSTVGQMSVCVRVNQGGVSVVTHCLEKETRPKNGVHGRE
jgi:hypothetical protein